jgi:hypothetical protein
VNASGNRRTDTNKRHLGNEKKRVFGIRKEDVVFERVSRSVCV